YFPVVETGGFRNEMPFADDSGFVTMLLQDFGKGLLCAIEPFASVLHKAIFMTVFTRQDGCPAWATDGVATVIIQKQGAFFGNTVDVGCWCFSRNGMAVSADRLFGMVVAHDKYHIGPLVICLSMGV